MINSLFSLAAALFLLLTTGLNRCGKASETPACIQSKIEQIKKEPARSIPAEVHEYSFRGQRVFYFNADCCDQFDEVFSADCQRICAPSGGITGKGDGLCKGFKDSAIYVRLVWKDERKP